MELVGEYELVGQVAATGSGFLWKGWDRRLSRFVALKQVAEDAVADVVRLRAEARLLADLEHPNIVTVYDLLEEHGQVWLVEEWVEGVSLSSLAAASFSAQQAIGVVHGALTGLAHVHHLGLVHGDVSPGNVVLDAAGMSKLVDFGLAAPSGIPGVGGTPGYLSPEAMRGHPVTARGDVYSAAAVLGMLLRGRPLFAGATAEAILAAQLTVRAPDLSGVRGGLRSVLSRSLAGEPADRYADAAQLLDALDLAARQEYGVGWLGDAAVVSLVAGAATFSGLMATAPERVTGTGRPSQPSGSGQQPLVQRPPVETGLTGSSAEAVGALGRHQGARPLSPGDAAPPRARKRWRRRPALAAAAAVVVVAVATVAVAVTARHHSHRTPIAGIARSSPASVARSSAVVSTPTLAPSAAFGTVSRQTFAAVGGVATNVYYGVSCPAANVCIATGKSASGAAILSKTTDDGLTWTTTQPALQSPVGLLVCVSPADCVAAEAPASTYTFLYTSDGGQSWTRATFPPAQNMDAVSCPTSTDCLAIGGLVNGVPTTAPQALASIDGGHTWHAVAPAGQASALDCLDSSHCWAAGPGGVWFSSDLGASWRQLAAPSTFPGPGVAPTQGIGNLALYYAAVAFGSDSTGIAAGGARCGGQGATQCSAGLVRTTSDGSQWTFWPVSDDTYGFIDWALCVGPNCLAVSDTFEQSSLLTSDNGSTWTPGQRFPGFIGHPACTPTGTLCVLAGASGLYEAGLR